MEGQPTANSSQTHSSDRQADCSLINNLREQVHRAFLQINEMEKFHHMEAEERQAAWREKEQEYQKKIATLEGKLQQSSFIIDLGDVDDSTFFEEIVHVKDSMRDSGIERLQQLLTESERASMSHDLDAKMRTFNQLEKDITAQLKQVPTSLNRLFQLYRDVCLQNCRMWEELRNMNEDAQLMKSKLQQAYGILTKYRMNETRWKGDCTQLRGQVDSWRKRYFEEAKSKDAIQQNLLKLEQQVSVNMHENMKLQSIIKEQESQLSVLKNEQSVLNENHEVNDSRSINVSSSINQSSNMSTLSNFLARLNKPVPAAERKQGCKPNSEGKMSLKLSGQTSPSITNMFKKKQVQKTQN